MIPSLLSYSVFERALTATDAKQSLLTPTDKREAEYFRENIRTVETPEDFMKDFRLYKFAMRAFNMDDQINARAVVKKSLEEGVSNSESFANKWSDKRFTALARTFGFAEKGTQNVESKEFADFVIKQYNVVTREVRAGEENPAVRLAAYFKRNAGGINNWYEVIASKPLRDVVMKALNVPTAVQTQNVQAVAKFLDSKHNIADFKDPEKVDKFIQRYLINNDLGAGQTSAGTSRYSAALMLLTSAGNAAGSNGKLFNLSY